MKKYDISWWQYCSRYDGYVDRECTIEANSLEEAISETKKNNPRAKDIKVWN